jgi:hypothetical protein
MKKGPEMHSKYLFLKTLLHIVDANSKDQMHFHEAIGIIVF